jgi:hypothetical protein
MKTNILIRILIINAIVLIEGCSTNTVATNNSIRVPIPSIASPNSIADIEIGEQILGEACSNEYLLVFKSGDDKYLEFYGNGSSSQKDKAKAAAAYKALFGKKGFSTDIIVHPIWEITRDKTFFGFLADEYCAKVAGFRGKIRGFKQSTSFTQESKTKQ